MQVKKKKQGMQLNRPDGLGLNRCWIPDDIFNSDTSSGLEGFYKDKIYMDKIKECQEMRETGKGVTVLS